MLSKFKQALKHTSKLTIILSGDEDSLTMVIIADPKKDGIKVYPISIKGSYAEVDAELEKALELVFEKNDAILSNVAIVANGVKKAAEEKTKKSTEKKTVIKTAAPAPKKKDELFKEDEDPAEDNAVEEENAEDEDNDQEEQSTDISDSKLDVKPNPESKPKVEKVTDTRTPEVKAAEKNCLEIIERVKTTKDTDMVEFLRKQAIAVCEKAKVPQTGIEKMLETFNKAIPFKPTIAPPAPVEHIEEVAVVKDMLVIETKSASAPLIEIPIASPTAAPVADDEDIF